MPRKRNKKTRAQTVVARAKKATESLLGIKTDKKTVKRLRRPRILLGAGGLPNTDKNFARILEAVTGRAPDTASRQFQGIFGKSRGVLGDTIGRSGVREIIGSSRGGLFSDIPAALKGRNAGGALAKALTKGGLAKGLGKASIAAFVLSLLGDFIGGLGEDRRRTSEFRRIAGNPDLLRGSILENLEDEKLNQIRVGRNLARLRKLGIQSPKVMQVLEQRSLGLDTLVPGEIQLGRSAIADRDDLLK